jgi:hypothetical protein
MLQNLSNQLCEDQFYFFSFLRGICVDTWQTNFKNNFQPGALAYFDSIEKNIK